MSIATETRRFEPGTTGWSAHDLDDPLIEGQWLAGRYEIVEGVLTRMPAAYYDGGSALDELVFILKAYLKSRGMPSRFAGQVDIILDESRVLVPDEVWLTPTDKRRQNEAARRAGRSSPRRTRILVPPTLVIESVSPGHEQHDRRTKRRWYAEFGVPNYWILDGFQHSLECLMLKAGAYETDAMGRDTDVIRPALFSGLEISLNELWED